MPGGTRRNLSWVSPHTDFRRIAEEERLLLADAQTSGGLLVAGEVPGASVIGELVPGDGTRSSSADAPSGRVAARHAGRGSCTVLRTGGEERA